MFKPRFKAYSLFSRLLLYRNENRESGNAFSTVKILILTHVPKVLFEINILSVNSNYGHLVGDNLVGDHTFHKTDVKKRFKLMEKIVKISIFSFGVIAFPPPRQGQGSMTRIDWCRKLPSLRHQPAQWADFPALFVFLLYKSESCRTFQLRRETIAVLDYIICRFAELHATCSADLLAKRM